MSNKNQIAQIMMGLVRHNGDPVRALSEAAIPPRDSFLFIDWYRGGNKKLKLDKNFEKYIERSGPAVRTFLGGLGGRIDPKTGKFVRFHNYTILGALYHADIIGTDGRITQVIRLKNRKDEHVGEAKYPMIVLAVNDDPVDAGLKTA
ncbi:MAG: hypothetical protein A3E88_05225 [Legionellales bacterium RIFCSPHIGHO2_12_FULL_35_11]|nr:MAG: hypothetical protein A3E88_05225 [Legionellales bacterium RIFCSPHIGHO2_12_FULL_35_11]